MDILQAIALAAAAFAAGGINAVAGGGTLIGFPALIAAGYTAKVANVTNTVALWPGTIGASWAYLPELRYHRHTLKVIAVPLVVGALIGSILLLSTSNEVFETFVPFLILGACGLLALQGRIARLVATGEINLQTSNRLPLQIGIFLASIYGGYFGAGLGIVLLALFGALLTDNIQHANALKGIGAFVVNGLATVYFAAFGDVVWEAALLMALFALLGGYVGARIAKRLPRERLRLIATGYGTVAAILLIVR